MKLERDQRTSRIRRIIRSGTAWVESQLNSRRLWRRFGRGLGDSYIRISESVCLLKLGHLLIDLAYFPLWIIIEVLVGLPSRFVTSQYSRLGFAAERDAPCVIAGDFDPKALVRHIYDVLLFMSQLRGDPEARRRKFTRELDGTSSRQLTILLQKLDLSEEQRKSFQRLRALQRLLQQRLRSEQIHQADSDNEPVFVQDLETLLQPLDTLVSLEDQSTECPLCYDKIADDGTGSMEGTRVRPPLRSVAVHKGCRRHYFCTDCAESVKTTRDWGTVPCPLCRAPAHKNKRNGPIARSHKSKKNGNPGYWMTSDGGAGCPFLFMEQFVREIMDLLEISEQDLEDEMKTLQ